MEREQKVYTERAERGFTIIELLVAMAILGLLIAVMIPGIAVVQRGARNTARRTGCEALQGKIEEAYGTNRVYPTSMAVGTSKSTKTTLYVSASDVDAQFASGFSKPSAAPSTISKGQFMFAYTGTTTSYTLTCYLEPKGEAYTLTVK